MRNGSTVEHSTPSLRDSKILIVEDDPDQANLVITWLKKDVGAQVDWVQDGEQAPRALKRTPYALVVADVEVPYMNGMDIAKVTKLIRPKTKVALMTGHSKTEYILEGIRSQVDEFVLKPLRRREFVDRMQELILAHMRSKDVGVVRVLAVGAHPDDVEIGVGGTLMKHRRAGHEITILTLTKGAQGGVENARALEAQAAADVLSAELVLEDLVDTRIHGGPDTIQRIDQVVARVKPDVIYTHSRNDRHQDHRAVYEASMVSSRKTPNVYCYQAPSATTDFRPEVFKDIGEVLDRKLKLIACYDSQVKKCDYLDPELIRSTARYWGRFAGANWVEPLEAIRVYGS